MRKVSLHDIPVVVNFSRVSPHRQGRLTIFERGDTIVFEQSLVRSEQWETDAPSIVYVPRGLLEALFATPTVSDPHSSHAHRELGGNWGQECLLPQVNT